MKEIKFDGLRRRLEKLSWPAGYLFKFIVPVAQASQIIDILPGEEYSTKKSGNGNYISITSYSLLESEDAVIDIYRKASRVQGVISL